MQAYEFPGPDPKFEPCSLSDRVLRLVQAGQDLGLEEQYEFLDWLVYAARYQLNRTISPHNAKSEPPILKAGMTGKCEFAQAVMSYGLEDMNIKHHCFSVDLIYLDLFRRQASFKHVGITVALNVCGQRTLFLIDPTFRQFCTLDHLGRYDTECPGAILAKTQQGQGMMDQLLHNGWIKLTPQIAQLYLQSFNTPSWAPCPKPHDAMRYFENPPDQCDKREYQKVTVKNYPLCHP